MQEEKEEKKTTTIHDSGYKRLFSNKTIFRQLIETFVEEDWVAKLDFERAERLEKSFVSEHYKETEADIIYKVPLRDSEKVIYLCLLIEFQSTVYRFMSVRSLQYTTDFYMDFILSNKNVRGLKLPAIFPLVLYNGDDTWTAPENIDALIENEIDLGEYGLHFKHFVIAENEFGKEWLLKIRNIISTLFLAEAHYNYETLRDELVHLCDTEQDEQALELFVNWLRQLAHHGRIEQVDFDRIEVHYLTREERKSMLIKALEQERINLRQEGYEIGTKEGYNAGKEEGKQEGKLEGRQEGKLEGKQEGYELGIEVRNWQIVHAMATNGFPIETIVQLVFLSTEEVERLLRQSQPPTLQPTPQTTITRE